MLFLCCRKKKARTLLAQPKYLIGKLLTPVCSSSLSSSLELGSIILTRECVYLTAANSNLYALICKSKSTNKQKEREKKTNMRATHTPPLQANSSAPGRRRCYRSVVCVCVLVTDILLSSFAPLNHHKHIEFTLRSIVSLSLSLIQMRFDLADWSSSIQFALPTILVSSTMSCNALFFSLSADGFFSVRLQSWSPQLDFSLMTQIFSIKNIYCFLWF